MGYAFFNLFIFQISWVFLIVWPLFRWFYHLIYSV